MRPCVKPIMRRRPVISTASRSNFSSDKNFLVASSIVAATRESSARTKIPSRLPGYHYYPLSCAIEFVLLQF